MGMLAQHVMQQRLPPETRRVDHQKRHHLVWPHVIHHFTVLPSPSNLSCIQSKFHPYTA